MKNYLYSFLICYCLFTQKPVMAARVFSDDFSGDLNKWSLVNGDMNYWKINNQALYANVYQPYRLSTIVPKDEFWQGISEYTVDFVFKVFDGADKSFVVGMRDAANFYDFHFYSNQLIVEDIRNGFSLHSMTVPFILETNRDYLIHLTYSKAKIELLVNGVKIFTTDEFWSPSIYGGKFGLKISTGSFNYSQAFFDQVEVRELIAGNVIFKQHDPSWGAKIYDHANLWSTNPSMASWACAVSSVAMLLRAYGYQNLPNGLEVNPWSLNLWLIDQSDGYIAGGLVNWLSISRLSKILSEQNNNLLPKLEFSYFKGNEMENLAALRTNLAVPEAQIAAVPGHFFLVADYLDQQNDFFIKDPLYEYSLLSQRTDKVESLRLFRPSLTDLSYLLFVLPREMDFSLVDESGAAILEPQIVTEEINAFAEKIGENYKLIYYPKPNSGNLNLLLDNQSFSKELIDNVQIFLYQKNGEVQVFNLNNLIGGNQDLNKIDQLLLKINYLKEVMSSVSLEVIEKTIDQQKLIMLDTVAGKSKKDFDEGRLSFYLFYQLNLLIDSLRERLNYFFLLQKFLDFHQL